MGVEPVDPKYIPTCEVNDIVIVRARQRKEYDGCKAKVLQVLTGDVKVEVLDGRTAGTKDGIRKFKFGQVSKVVEVPIVKAATADQTKKGTKEAKAKDALSLMDFMKAAAGDMS